MTRTIEQLQSPAAARLWCAEARKAGRSIGFVPTMGALHAGHIGLVRQACAANDLVVVSIFVNPLQFGEQADLDAYPREFVADAALLEDAGCDMVFTGTLLGDRGFFPEASSREDIEVVAPGKSALGLEGEFRGGHFEGVATIVRRLFEVAQPTRAYFGEKDYQQTLVVRDLAEGMGDAGPQVILCRIAREDGGLARSSRNARLSTEGLWEACALSRSLAHGCQLWRGSGVRDPLVLEAAMLGELAKANVKVEYVAVRDPNAWTAERPSQLNGKAIALVAAEVDGVRLIDNMRLDVASREQPVCLTLRESERAVVIAEAPAKINPWLEVKGKRADGFHEVDLTMLCIDLVDHLRVSWVDSGRPAFPESAPSERLKSQIELSVFGPAATGDIPLDSSNLVWRAAELALAAHSGELPKGHLCIELYKRIPSRAGLGGGSSDAAAALAATARLLELVGCGVGELGTALAQARALAAIGSDCAFFLAAAETGFGRCTGRGERVEELDGGAHNLRQIQLVVPAVACGTGAVYSALVLPETPRQYSKALTFNRLLEPALIAFPELASARNELAVDGRGEWEMSGSGSALYRDFEAPLWFDCKTGEVPELPGARYSGCHRPTGNGVRLLSEICASPASLPNAAGEFA